MKQDGKNKFFEMTREEVKKELKKHSSEIDLEGEVFKQYGDNRFISNKGRVLAIPTTAYAVKKTNVLSFGSLSNNTMQFGAGRKKRQVKDAVWRSFKGEIQTGYRISHINGKGWDNRLENLEIIKRNPNDGGSMYEEVSDDKRRIQ